MTLPKVSIIIPIWGVEQYIRDCIRSVFAQDYRGAMECILVNDCTPDGSMAVVEQELKSYEGKIEFYVLSHEKNRGLSAARNTGMEKATGDYIFFLDSDDEITPDCISSLAKPLSYKPYDMVIGDIRELNSERTFQWLSLPTGEMLSSQQIRTAYLEWKWYPMAQNKLYSATFLQRYALLFKEGLVHEDELWTAQIAFLLRSMYIVRQETYLYKIRENSIMTSLDARKDIKARCEVLRELGNFYNQYGLMKDITANGLMIRMFDSIIPLSHENNISFNEVYAQARHALMVDKCTIFFRSEAGFLGRLIHSHLLFPPSFGKYYYPFVKYFIKKGVDIKGYVRSKMRMSQLGCC